jgi:hypothetical protein
VFANLEGTFVGGVEEVTDLYATATIKAKMKGEEGRKEGRKVG